MLSNRAQLSAAGAALRCWSRFERAPPQDGVSAGLSLRSGALQGSSACTAFIPCGEAKHSPKSICYADGFSRRAWGEVPAHPWELR